MKKGLGCLNKREREVIGSLVKELKEKLGDEIISIRLFGSKARGDFHEDSDIVIVPQSARSMIQSITIMSQAV